MASVMRRAIDYFFLFGGGGGSQGLGILGGQRIFFAVFFATAFFAVFLAVLRTNFFLDIGIPVLSNPQTDCFAILPNWCRLTKYRESALRFTRFHFPEPCQGVAAAEGVL